MDDCVRGGQDASPVGTSAAASTEGLKRGQSYSDPTPYKRLRRRGDEKKIQEWFEKNFFPPLPNTNHTPKTQLLFTGSGSSLECVLVWCVEAGGKKSSCFMI